MQKVKGYQGLERSVVKTIWPSCFAVLLRSSPSVRRVAHPGQEKHSAQRGQIVLEYILLLVISVGVATLLTKSLVSRNPASPGILTGAWNNINTVIGNDIID